MAAVGLAPRAGGQAPGAAAAGRHGEPGARVGRRGRVVGIRCGAGVGFRRLGCAAAQPLAGLPLGAAELLALSAALALACAAGLVLLADQAPAPAALLALGAGVAPWLWVARCREQRRLRVERQFPQALDLLGRALRAGHAFPAAVRMAAEELPQPLVRDFRLLFEEMNYGVPVPQALARFAQRVPLADAGYFAVAVTIQRESGGNLAEVLDKIAGIVRARLRLFGEIRTMSAEGRLSAVILTALPFVVALVVQLVHPKFLAVLWTDELGKRLVGAALAGIVLGVLWMRTIIRIRV